MSAAPRLVAVGSRNPTKVAAVRAVLAATFPAAGVVALDVASGVRTQPLSLEETRRGALRRAEAALQHRGADWGIGMEGGVDFDPAGRCWLCGAVTAAVRAGAELGPVMDALSGESGTKERQGAIGILTAGLVPRQTGWQVALACALAPLLRPELYGDG